MFADKRLIERIAQLESEVALLQDIVAEMRVTLATLEEDPAIASLRASVEVVNERQSPFWAAP